MPQNIINRTLSAFLRPLTAAPSTNIAEVSPELAKAEAMGKPKEDIISRDLAYLYNNQTGNQNNRSANGTVGYDTLRGLAHYYPIARACINYRKNQVKALHWEITGKESGEEINEEAAEFIAKFLKRPYGANSSLKMFLDIVIQDLLVLDAVAAAYERNFKGELIGLPIIDPATIRLRVDTTTGRLPSPPEIAYVQYIKGAEVAQMTTDDMFYGFLNGSSYSPYGTSLMETLIMTVNTALQIQNRNYRSLQAGSVPEGLGTVPDTWTIDQLREWQDYWDAFVSNPATGGNALKWVPGGTNYMPTNSRDEAGYAAFEEWLMHVTCAIFNVPPEELGFTSTVNKSTSDSQKETAIDLGLKPIASFIEDMITDIIESQLGIDDLQFKFTDLDPNDTELELKKESHEIIHGIKSIKQAQMERGYEVTEELGHIIALNNAKTIQQLIQGEIKETKEPAAEVEPQKEEPKTPEKEEEPEEESFERLRKSDFKVWRKRAIADVKNARNYRRPFQSNYIDADLIEEIEDRLSLSDGTVASIDKVFAPYVSDASDLLIKIKQLGDSITRD